MSGDPNVVNDVHSRLNPTRVADVVRPRDSDELRSAVRLAADRRLRLSVCGGRHAMGAQQFGTDTLLIDTTLMSNLLRLDTAGGLAEFQAGATWPTVIDALLAAQKGA